MPECPPSISKNIYVLRHISLGVLVVNRKYSSGFTLAELLVVCGILAVLLAYAVPGFASMLSSLRLRKGADTFFTSVLLTRSEAVKRNSRVVMCKSDNGKVCASGGDWNQGWIIFHDANNNAEVDAGESIVWHQQSVESRIKITGNGPVQKYVSYTGFGTSNLVSGAFQAGTLTFCQISPSPTDAWQIVINKTGRPRSVKTTVKQCI